jgi:protein-tyrosine kinase
MSKINQALKRRQRETGQKSDHEAEVPLSQGVPLERFPGENVRAHESAHQLPVAPTTKSEGSPWTSLTTQSDQSDTPAIFRGFNRSVVGKLVASREMDPGSLEQYRRLAAALHHAQVQRGTKKVMVASAVGGEGKTLTALNLALTLSESYRRQVVLIDADLRRPRIHELLDIVGMPGLNEALKDTRKSKLGLVAVSPRLSVLPAGKPDPDPMGPLTSQAMDLILNEMAANFDWIIVDTPPVVLLPDTNLLAGMVDAAVLVIEAGRTSYDLINRTLQALGRNRILGVVLNGVDRTDLTYSIQQG